VNLPTVRNKVYSDLEDHVHINPVGVGPGVLEVLLQALLQRVRDLVELVELPHPLHRRMVPVHHQGQEALAPGH
jgi:hypothetical protein